jgi:hypothetical protein
MDDKSLEYTISRSVLYKLFYFPLFLYYRLRPLLLAAEHQRMVAADAEHQRMVKKIYLTFVCPCFG